MNKREFGKEIDELRRCLRFVEEQFGELADNCFGVSKRISALEGRSHGFDSLSSRLTAFDRKHSCPRCGQLHDDGKCMGTIEESEPTGIDCESAVASKLLRDLNGTVVAEGDEVMRDDLHTVRVISTTYIPGSVAFSDGTACRSPVFSDTYVLWRKGESS